MQPMRALAFYERRVILVLVMIAAVGRVTMPPECDHAEHAQCRGGDHERQGEHAAQRRAITTATGTAVRWQRRQWSRPEGEVLVHRQAVGVFGGQARAGARVWTCDVDDERERALWGERGGRAVCVEGAYEEREADGEADGDDERAADRAEAKYSGGHNW